MRFGYCCINLSLSKKEAACSRSMRKSSLLLDEKGLTESHYKKRSLLPGLYAFLTKKQADQWLYSRTESILDKHGDPTIPDSIEEPIFVHNRAVTEPQAGYRLYSLGPKYTRTASLALDNAKGLERIMRWNIEHKVSLFRVTSDICPWQTHVSPDMYPITIQREFKNTIKRVGDMAMRANIRVTFHPSHFNVLASTKSHVVESAKKEIIAHANLFDLMGFPRSPFYTIIVHVWSSENGLAESAKRFLDSFADLPINARFRMGIENDDKATMFSVNDLYDLIVRPLREMHHNCLPIVFDWHHHRVGSKHGISDEIEAARLAFSTWKNLSYQETIGGSVLNSDFVPLCHMSSSAGGDMKPAAHSDYIQSQVPRVSEVNSDKLIDFDTELEAKAKDLALMDYCEKFENGRMSVELEK